MGGMAGGACPARPWCPPPGAGWPWPLRGGSRSRPGRRPLSVPEGGGSFFRHRVLLRRSEQLGEPEARRMLGAEGQEGDGDRHADEGAEDAPEIAPEEHREQKRIGKKP